MKMVKTTLAILPLVAAGLASTAASPGMAQEAPGAPGAPDLRLRDAASSTQAGGIRTRRREPGRATAMASPLPQPPQPPRLDELPRLPAVTNTIAPPSLPPSSSVRRQTETSEGGTRLGAFVLGGEVEAGGVWTSRRDESGRDATGARLAPDLRLTSNWARHELAFSASGEFIAWSRGPLEANGTVGASLRLDARRDLALRTTLSWQVDKLAARSLALEHQLDATQSIEWQRYRVQATAAVGVMRSFQTNVDESDSYTQPHASVRLRLRTAPALALYGEVGGDVREHRLSADSKGAYGEAGVELLRGPVLEGRLGVRGEWRKYDDGTHFSGIGVNGNVTWRPTRTASLGLDAAFDLQDAADSGRVRQQTIGLFFQQRPRRDLDWRGRLEVEHDDAVGSEDSLNLRLSTELAWRIWRRLWLVPGYAYERTFVKGGPDPDPEHQVRLSLRRRY